MNVEMGDAGESERGCDKIKGLHDVWHRDMQTVTEIGQRNSTYQFWIKTIAQGWM